MSRYSLVLLKAPIVAQDLALTVEELTGCVAITASAVEESCLKLAGLGPGSLVYAFIQSDVASLRESPLVALIERIGGQIILTGHPAEIEELEKGASWPVLRQPFGPAQVAELLARIASPSPTRD